MSWRDKKMRVVVILILVTYACCNAPTYPVDSVWDLLTLVITATVTAAANELVRVVMPQS